MKPRLFITQPVFPEHEALLAEHFELTINREDDHVLEPAAIRRGLAGCAYLFCRLGDPVDASVIEAAPALSCIATMASRPSHIDLAAAERRHIAVLVRQNSRDGLPSADNTPDTADLTFALLLALARRIIPGDQGMRRGEFPGPQSHRYAGLAVTGASLGLIGMGAVARHMVRRALGFDMRVSYWSRSRKEDVEQQYDIAYQPLDELLATSDIVSLHINSSPKTRHFLGRERLALMKPEAILVNTARGELVDQEALFEALRAGRLAGAGLDVFEGEPHPSLPQDLVGSPRLVVTPHLGSAVKSKRLIMERVVCLNLIDHVSGRGQPEGS